MDTIWIIFWVFFALCVIGFLALVKKTFPTEIKVKSLAMDAMIIAIIVIMGLIPQVGYIMILPGLSLTLVHLPVLLGCYIGGPKKGLLYGLVFGLTSWYQAMFNMSGLNIFFIYPWISVLPRVLFGFIAGLVFSFLRKLLKGKDKFYVTSGASFLLTVVHTALVFSCLFIFYPTEMISLFGSSQEITQGVTFFFFGVILLGAAGEALLAAILIPILGKVFKEVSVLKKE